MNGQPKSSRLMQVLLGVCLAVSLVAVILQQNTESKLRRELQSLRGEAQELQQLRQENAELQPLRAQAQEFQRLRNENQELLRLRGEVRQLRQQSNEVERLRADNLRLQGEARKALAGGLPPGTPEPIPPAVVLSEAQARVQRIQCVSNLKQIGLAARMWANDHGDVIPADFLAMRLELNSPRVLICPGDPSKANLYDDEGKLRPEVLDWNQFDPRNISYQFVSPGVNVNGDPQRVLAICPVHNNVGYIDGSVAQAPAGK